MTQLRLRSSSSNALIRRGRGDTCSHREHGVILTWLVFALPVLLLLAYFVLNTVQFPLIKARVQSASDSAAHGATLILDPNDDESWDRSVVVAKSILRNFEAELGGFGDALDQTEGPIFEDSGGRAKITIERGRYMPGVSLGGEMSAGDFQSLELESLEDNGLSYLEPVRKQLANAVNIRLELAATSGIGSVFAPTWGDGGFSLSGITIASETTVTFGQSEEFVPPFALPLCALLDGASTFDPNAICRADRLFTTLEWQEKFSGAAPDFMYDPGPNTNVQTNECYYDSPSYLDADNNYGVLGLPSGDDSVEPDAIMSALDTAGDHPGLVRATIGQRFAPLRPLPTNEDIPEITATEIGDRIWKLITNPKGLSDDPTWPTFAEGLAEMTQSPSAAVQPNWIPYPQGSAAGSPPQPEQSGFWEERCGGGGVTFRPENQNMCGSHRFSWNCDGASLCETPAFGTNENTVWRVKVPLIAEIDNGHISQCGAPAPLDPNRNYRIIGFITVVVYDSDIGLPRPDPATLNVQMVQYTSNPTAICGNAFSVSLPQPDGTANPPETWTAFGPICAGPGEPMYMAPPGPPCNVIRARVDCDTAFEATKQAKDGTFSLRLVR